MTSLDFAGGKYTVVHNNGVALRALRYGEPWRDLSGDGLVLAMAQEVEDLKAELVKQGSNHVRRVLEVEKELAAIHRLANCGTTQNWLMLSDEEKAKWLGLLVSESSRRKAADEKVEAQDELIAQLTTAFQTIAHSMGQARIPGNDRTREMQLSADTAAQALELIAKASA